MEHQLLDQVQSPERKMSVVELEEDFENEIEHQ